MKYVIKREKQEDEFKPFSITLIFETREEYIHFHDNVMGLLTPTRIHKFHGDVFFAGHGEIDEVHGEI